MLLLFHPRLKVWKTHTFFLFFWFKIYHHIFICQEFTGGFLIVAGKRSYTRSPLLPTEKFNPFSDESCPAGEINRRTIAASFCNNLLCGGDPTFRSCEKFDGVSTFEALAVSLVERRKFHICWGLQSGEVLLMGGHYSATTTELVSADGTSSSTNYSLPYVTM